MAAAKKAPSDHKSKALDPATSRTLTVDGKPWSVDLTALASWDVMDDIGEMDAGNFTRAPRLLRALLGPQQYVHARAAFNGPDSLEKGSAFLLALINAMREAAAPNS